MMPLAIRGWKDGARVFEEFVDAEEADFEKLGDEHSRRLVEDDLHMVEFEFLDEPDENQRFFRIGTDPRGMVQPVAIILLEAES